MNNMDFSAEKKSSTNKKKQTIFAVTLGVLALFFLLLCLLVVELGFGSWFSGDVKLSRKIVLLKEYVAYFDVGHLYKRDPSTIKYSRDKNGLRGNYDPAGNGWKIIAVGGSTTDCRYVDDSSVWTEILRMQLTNHYHKPVYVGNAGMDGHSSRGHITSLNYWLPPLKPNVVVFLVGINDMAKRETNDDYDHAMLSESLPFKDRLKKEIRENSVIFDVYKKIKYTFRASEVVAFRGGASHARLQPDFFKDDELVEHSLSDKHKIELSGWVEAYRARLQKLVDGTRKLNALPVFVTQPSLYGPSNGTPDSEDYSKAKVEYMEVTISGAEAAHILSQYNEAVLSTCKANNLYCIDLNKLLPKNSKIFYDYFHFTEEGSQKVGKIIADAFIQKNILTE